MKFIRNILGLGLALIGFSAFAEINIKKLAKQKWIQVSTPHLEIVTDAKPKVGQALARELEHFRYFISVHQNQKLYEGVPPLKILALSKRSTFKALGLPDRWAGVFVNHIDGPLAIANISGYSTSDSRKSFGNQVIMHEYVHYASHAKFGRQIYPLWYSEGIAEYLATFKIIEKGKTISIGDSGLLTDRSWSLLNRSGTRFKKIDVEDLFKTRDIKKSWRDEENSKKKRDEQRAFARFYARAAWAYHYLNSSKELKAQTARYIDLINRGYSVDSAFAIAFNGIGFEKLDDDIYSYMTGKYTYGWKYSAGEGGLNLPQPEISISKLDAAGGMKGVALSLAVFSSTFKPEEKEKLVNRAMQLNADDPDLLAAKLLVLASRKAPDYFEQLDKALIKFPEFELIKALDGDRILNRAYKEFLVGHENVQATIREGRNTIRPIVRKNPFNARAFKALAEISSSTAESKKLYLEEACIAAESVRLLGGDRPRYIMQELDCSIKLQLPETVTVLLRKYANASRGDWIDKKYGRFMLDSFNLRDQALTKPASAKKKVLKYENGSVYEGGSKNNLPHGTGKLTMFNGATAEGNWVDGKLEGKGVFLASNKYKYSGEFKDGTISGYGRIVYPEGELFKSSEGEFLYAFEHGKHRFDYSTGLIVDGYAQMGAHHGLQKITMPDGAQSDVNFAYGRPRLALPNGDIFVGVLEKDGNLNEKGLCYSSKNVSFADCEKDASLKLADAIK